MRFWRMKVLIVGIFASEGGFVARAAAAALRASRNAIPWHGGEYRHHIILPEAYLHLGIALFLWGPWVSFVEKLRFHQKALRSQFSIY